jgi:hypothetical protein
MPTKRERLQDIEGRIDFPPFEPLPHAALVGMMVVVPAFAHGEQRQQPIIARIVAGQIPLPSHHMRERVDAESAVIDEDGAPEESDEQARPARDEKAE